MPFLTVVGSDLAHAMNQARDIMGDAPPIFADHRVNVDYFEFSTEDPVNSQVHGFQAAIPGQTVCVLWIHY